jgi:hypothetical protein
MHNLLTRDDFREGVFQRDEHSCVVCGKDAVDAHHIIERKLFNDGGYYLDNGVSLCADHHLDAEMSRISCEELRTLAKIKSIILPEGYDSNLTYDKWGKEIFVKHVKYPRTPHLPWSEKCTDDDKRLVNVDHFKNQEVIVTIKMDGENTTMYDDKIHARSLNSNNHISRDWVKGLWSSISYQIPADWRICGENLYALHTIPYNHLTSYFNVISIWNKDYCMGWDETVEWCELLQLETVPVIYRGIFNEKEIIKSFPREYNGDPTEGYVVRLTSGFDYKNFDKSVAKFVANSFIISTENHWMQSKVIVNKIDKL